MHTSSIVNRTVFTRVGVGVALLVTALFASGPGCSESQEGDRCNPSLSHQECNAGLSCQQPVDCPENYCCPINGTSNNPNCQPGCNGGLASICAADPTYDACVTDAEAVTDAGPDVMSADTGVADSAVVDT